MALVPGIEVFCAIALVGVVIGTGFGLARSDLPRTSRILPAAYIGLGISAVPAIIFLIISGGAITGFASGDWPFLQWIFAGLMITILAFIVIGLPLIGGASIPPQKRHTKRQANKSAMDKPDPAAS